MSDKREAYKDRNSTPSALESALKKQKNQKQRRYDSNGKFQTSGAIHRVGDMRLDDAHRLRGVRHPLIIREIVNGVFRVAIGVIVAILSTIAYFGFILWLLTL